MNLISLKNHLDLIRDYNNLDTNNDLSDYQLVLNRLNSSISNPHDHLNLFISSLLNKDETVEIDYQFLHDVKNELIERQLLFHIQDKVNIFTYSELNKFIDLESNKPLFSLFTPYHLIKQMSLSESIEKIELIKKFTLSFIHWHFIYIPFNVDNIFNTYYYDRNNNGYPKPLKNQVDSFEFCELEDSINNKKCISKKPSLKSEYVKQIQKISEAINELNNSIQILQNSNEIDDLVNYLLDSEYQTQKKLQFLLFNNQTQRFFEILNPLYKETLLNVIGNSEKFKNRRGRPINRHDLDSAKSNNSKIKYEIHFNTFQKKIFDLKKL